MQTIDPLQAQQIRDKNNDRKLTNWESEIECNLTQKSENKLNELKNQLRNFINNCNNQSYINRAQNLLIKLESFLNNSQQNNDNFSPPLFYGIVTIIVLVSLMLAWKIRKIKSLKQ